jgi:stage V sporulation protein AD
MGAAMAPAAADCIVANFEDNSIDESYYDFIITGDLTSYGGDILCTLLEQNNIKIKSKHLDCGALIFDTKTSMYMPEAADAHVFQQFFGIFL